jgi:bacterial/archaeal transporter family-2 protein
MMRNKHMWTFVLLAVLGGMAIALQALINARLQQSAGNAVFAGTISFGVGLLALLAALATQSFSFSGLSSAPWWAWTGGALGAFYIVMSIFLVPRIGAAALIGSAVLGQMLFSLVADHYGILGTQVRPAGLARIAGAVLIMVGVALIRTR